MASNASDHPVVESAPLGFPWATVDPFLFCAYHNDNYPRGNENLGPDPSLLGGRQLGMDFTVKDGFRMYHGDVVPGFPAHPHRGFETVTLVSRGYCDHSDSLGAAARFGAGDVQWLTAGKGIVHSEMFPLLKADEGNPLELFQIWLNLPSQSKMVEPYFSIFWSQDIPQVVDQDDAGRKAVVTVVAGKYGEHSPPEPPPDSWANDPSHDVAIWTVSLQEGRKWLLPKTKGTSTRTLYFFSGDSVRIEGKEWKQHSVFLLKADADVHLEATSGEARFLVLQGRPIGQPVAQHGPFVMNTRAEIQQAISDYQQTQYGGWPWERQDPHHGPDRGRFARKPDGSVEEFPRTES